MNALPWRARLCWLTIVSAGGLVAVQGFVGTADILLDQAHSPLGPAVPLFILGGALGQLLRVRLPNPRRPLGDYARSRFAGCTSGNGRSSGPAGATEGETTSVASAVHAFALLALPVPVSVCVVAVSTLIAGGLSSNGRRLYQRTFNVAQYALAVWVAGSLWQIGQKWSDLGGGPLDLWLAPTLAVYLLANSGAAAAIAALVEDLPLRHVWARGRRSLLPSYVLLMLAGAVLWYLWRADALLPAGLGVGFGLVAIYHSLKQAVLLQQQTIDALANLADLMDQRDQYTHAHSLRVGHNAERLAARLGLSQEEAWLIFLCGRLHDIGKCVVGNDVLLKPGPLDPLERAEMARHATVGAQMLRHFEQFRVGASYVRAHHEWYDGSGYPDRLARSRIPLGARIIAVVDAYDAMTTDRPYRQALSHAEAVRRLLTGAGSQWDPRVVQVFLEMVGEAPRPPARAGQAGQALSTSGAAS